MLVERLLQLAMLGATWVMYLLLVLSVLSLAIIAERWWFFRRRAAGIDALRDEVAARIAADDLEGAEELLAESRSFEAGVIRPALPFLAGGPVALADAIDSELGRQRSVLDRGMNFLGTVGSNSPFIGLFGTVIGVIEAFAHLGKGTDDAAMANVMSGIAEALVATGIGLFVAIPAVVGFNWFQARIGRIEDGIGSLTRQLTAALLVRDASAAAVDREVVTPNGRAHAAA